MIEEGIIQRLLATSGVTSLVGTRVFPGVRPQAAALPAIVFTLVSKVPVYDDDGEAGIETCRVQIDSWATTYTQAKQLSRTVRASLSAYFGTSEGTESLYCQLDAERDLMEGGANAAEYLHRVSQDYLILNRS